MKWVCALMGCLLLAGGTARADDFPPADKVLEGYTKVVTTLDQKSFYDLYINEKTQDIVAELPQNYAKIKQFIALTVASGENYAGLQAGDTVVYWSRYNNRLALIEPNLQVRSSGDNESKSSVERLFTDRILLDVPIIAMGKKGGPLIDLDDLLVGQSARFFGSSAPTPRTPLVKVKTIKAFPKNIEVGFEAPGRDNRLRTYHYSISLLPEKTGYQPRVADERLGYFVTTYNDFGKLDKSDSTVRYINRWHLQKADPNLKLSPPKEPIVFYIEHSTPIRYRRWVREGVEMWNKAFEKVGIVNAIEVYQQDASTGAHMDKDPEDVRYNFVRWLSNGAGTAIGPSRVNPYTGQILDADIILTDGWIRHWWKYYNEIRPEIAMQGYGPEMLAWLHENPTWDPRVRLAPPSERPQILEQRAHGPMPDYAHMHHGVESELLGDDHNDGLAGRVSQLNGFCSAANVKAHGMASFQMAMAVQLGLNAEEAAEGGEGEAGEKCEKCEAEAKCEKCAKGKCAACEACAEKKEQKVSVPSEADQMLDGIAESFIGPQIKDLVAHEVGHTIGLRHNFKGTALYDYDAINSKEMKGKKPYSSTVMDYVPINIAVGENVEQGDYAVIDIGPYDYWVIEYGYTFEKDLKPILARTGDPALDYATDEDTSGPDPLARRYDFGKDPLEFAKNQIRLAQHHRKHILDKFVKDGESWSRARQGYLLTLSEQVKAVGMMSNWLGGAHIYRDKKGDQGDRAPIKVVPAEQQRSALAFVIENAFNDEAYGLTPDLLRHMSIDKWWDDTSSIAGDAAWPIHDQILGVQASVLTALMNPRTLEQVYDNEFRVNEGEDAITVAEVLQSVKDSVFAPTTAYDENGKYTARNPLLSSLERNLQREYVDRLVDICTSQRSYAAVFKPLSDLACMHLRDIQSETAKLAEAENLDPYSRSHLGEMSMRIGKALDAIYVIQ